MNDDRPNPEDLLADVQAQERKDGRGRLKIFLGYAAGVGKTYSMLESARRAKAAGRDVVLGYIEPHARPDTSALTSDFEIIAPLELNYRGLQVREFNVDLALQRRPELLLVDELAHSNAEGCRHSKRWQDIEEVLGRGVDVWTTLNVQHIESLNDVVAQVSGVTVRETIPDSVFESADEIELIDIAPDDLINRLEQGKIYAGEQAFRALKSFFQRSNLNALRELSLRQAARRIHTDVEVSRRSSRARTPWSTSERLMVCVGPSPTTAKVIRAAKRMAGDEDIPWVAVSVETPGVSVKTTAVQSIVEHFRLAESLGAETITLYGEDVAQTLVEYAREHNITRILVGKTTEPRWRRWFFGNLVDRLIDESANIDVLVIQGAGESKGLSSKKPKSTALKPKELAFAGLIIGVCSLIATLLRELQFADAEANTVMIFLAGVALVGYFSGRIVSIVACVVAVLTFDFFFVPPFMTFAVSDAQYFVTFFIMLVIGVGISSLTARLRRQVLVTQEREQRMSALYTLGKQLSALYGRVFLCNAAATKVAEMTGSDVVVYLANEGGMVEPASELKPSITSHPLSQGAAQWVTQHSQLAGSGTDTLPAAPALFLPLTGTQSCLGAIAVANEPMGMSLLSPENRHLLESCASHLALAIERDKLVIDAAEARIEAETEHLRSSLLSSVSHDLRTPLATIGGASQSLLTCSSLTTEVREELLKSIADEASRLSRLLENILQMSKLDSGHSQPNKQWHVLEDMIGVALARTEQALTNHHVTVDIPSSIPLIKVDGLMVEQLFVNLLENAALHTPAGTQVRIQAMQEESSLVVHVEDSGPGIPENLSHKVFNKFERAVSSPDSVRGSGLGLAIARAIAQGHGGNLSVQRSELGGADFILRLPLDKSAPNIPLG